MGYGVSYKNNSRVTTEVNKGLESENVKTLWNILKNIFLAIKDDNFIPFVYQDNSYSNDSERQRNNATWYDLLEKHNNSFELAAEHSTTIGSKVQRRYSQRIENGIPEELLFYLKNYKKPKKCFK